MQTRYVNIENTSSPLSFSVEYDTGRPWWNCVAHGKKPLYIVSNRCGTCPAVFKLVNEITNPLIAERMNALLNEGLTDIPDSIVEAMSALLPGGKYLVSLQNILPRYTRINTGEVSYNWINRLDTPYENGFMSESVYPILPEHVLDPTRIRHYYDLPYTSRKTHPTSLALSFFVARVLRGEGRYLYVGHILLDGHHKMMAASWRGEAISMLSFWITNSFVTDLFDGSADATIRSLYPDQ